MSTHTDTVRNVPAEAADISAARRGLREFAARYDYDTGYLEDLLDRSPAAHATFAAAMAMSHHRAHLPLDVHMIARLATLRADDCGACTQLTLRMAIEAGVDRELLRTALQRPLALPPVLALAWRHAQTVVRGENGDPEIVGALEKALGRAGFAELCLAIVGVRIYPALKRALGAEHACRVATVDF